MSELAIWASTAVSVVFGLLPIVGVCALIWTLTHRRPRLDYGPGWVLEPHKTNPGDRTGQRGREPDSLWPEYEETGIHYGFFTAPGHRRLPPGRP